MAAVTVHSDFGIQKLESITVSIVSPSISHAVMGLDAMIFSSEHTNFIGKLTNCHSWQDVPYKHFRKTLMAVDVSEVNSWA